MNAVITRSTLALTHDHTPAQMSAWSDCSQIANEIDRLHALRAEAGVNVAAINAKLDEAHNALAQAVAAYERA